MKKNPGSLLILAALLAMAIRSPGQTYTLDPATTINDYMVDFDFNTGNEGMFSFGDPVLSAASGVLTATTTSADPYMLLFPQWPWPGQNPPIPSDMTIVEARLRVLQGATDGWEFRFGNTPGSLYDFNGAGPGSAPPWTFDLGFADNGWHVFQVDAADYLGGTAMVDFRLDPGAAAGTIVEFDYIRIGKISPDTDNDGLPDKVETGTMIFNGRRDTGTYYDNPDSDGDGFNDGLEVSVGTDPTLASSSPQPGIPNGWSTPAAVYIVSVPIETNSPVAPIVGSPQSFAISPSLPAGLFLNATNGQIFGTPTASSPNTTYTIITTFVGDKTATNTITIEVRYPYITYGAADRKTFMVGAAISAFEPTRVNPPPTAPPTNYIVSPALPDGLTLDPTTGSISGTPTTYSPPTVYTMTAQYAATPDSQALFTMAVLEPPTFAADPAQTLANYDSIAEFDGDPSNGGQFRNDVSLTSTGTTLDVITEGALSWVGWGEGPDISLSRDWRVVEMRVKFAVPPSGNQVLYWKEALPNKSWGHTPASPFVLTQQMLSPLFDGNFHVIQIDLTRTLEAPLTGLRYDLAYFTPGIEMEIDYVRVGTLALPPELIIEPQGSSQIRVRWPLGLTGYTLQKTSALPGGWSDVSATVQTTGNSQYVDLPKASTAEFFRLKKN